MFQRLFGVCLMACALMVAGPLPANDRVAQEMPSAADFGALAIFEQPALSPDGRWIAARGRSGGKPVVMLIDLAAANFAIQSVPLPERHQLEWVRWAGSQRLIISLSKAASLFGEEVRATRLVLLDFATRDERRLGPREQGAYGDDVIYIDPQGDYLLLSTQANLFSYPSVYRVDLANGRSREIVPAQEDVWHWYADGNGVVRAGLGHRRGRSWLLYRSAAGESFRRMETPGRAAFDVEQVAPVSGTDQGYALANAANGRFSLYRYDFATGTLGEMLYEHPTVDIDSVEFDRAGALLGVHFVDDRPEITWLDPALRRQQERIDRALPGAVNRVVSASADRGRMLIWSGSATDPGTFLLYDRAANEMVPLVRTHEALAGKQLSPMEPVRYAARDGLEIRAYLTLPVGRDPAGLPLVVMPHGGPFARDAWGYDPWVQYLASKGYAVLQPNFRGSTGFGREFVRAGNGQWGRGMQDDIDDGVAWLAGRGTIDARRVCIMGASYGGYAAMWAAVRNPELYRCAISFAGISDVAAMLRYDRRSFEAPRYFQDWRERIQGDPGFELDSISPLLQVERMTVPILIAHGSEDDNVPMFQSRRLHEALTRIGRAHEYVIYPGEGHGFSDPEHSTDFLNRIGAFLDRHNPS